MTAPTVAQRGRRNAATDTGRLPAPIRERRPALAALAVILIVGGALISGLIALRSGERTEYLLMRQTVEVGHRMTSTDFELGSLAGSGPFAIPATQRGALVGQYATTRIYAKTLVTYEMFAEVEAVPANTAVVGVVLSAEQRPATDLKAGDVVAVYVVPSGQDIAGEAREIVAAAQVVEVAESRGGGGVGAAVSLLIPKDKVAEVTLSASQKRIAVVRLPPGTAPTTASATS